MGISHPSDDLDQHGNPYGTVYQSGPDGERSIQRPGECGWTQVSPPTRQGPPQHDYPVKPGTSVEIYLGAWHMMD